MTPDAPSVVHLHMLADNLWEPLDCQTTASYVIGSQLSYVTGCGIQLPTVELSLECVLREFHSKLLMLINFTFHVLGVLQQPL